MASVRLSLLGLVAVPLVASARVTTETPRPEPAPMDLVTPTMVVARLANALDLPIVPQGLLDSMIRWRLSARDLVFSAVARVATLADRSGFTVPDLTVLSTHPLQTSDSTWATSGFGWRDDPMRHRAKFHRGADIRAKSGTPVFCAGDGVVVFAGRQGGYGNVIYVDHGGGVVTRYAHLRRIETKKDAAITAGQRIGQVGSTGRATGPHLHFEVRLDGRAVDPGTAMSIAELLREAPEAGRVAAFALAPELQEMAQSELDPPRTRKKIKRTPDGPRPERTGRVKRVRPVS